MAKAEVPAFISDKHIPCTWFWFILEEIILYSFFSFSTEFVVAFRFRKLQTEKFIQNIKMLVKLAFILICFRNIRRGNSSQIRISLKKKTQNFSLNIIKEVNISTSFPGYLLLSGIFIPIIAFNVLELNYDWLAFHFGATPLIKLGFFFFFPSALLREKPVYHSSYHQKHKPALMHKESPCFKWEAGRKPLSQETMKTSAGFPDGTEVFVCQCGSCRSHRFDL